MAENLYIVIPAYNEEANIERVVKEWYPIVEKCGNGSKMVVIDDGSKDSTYQKLLNLVGNMPLLIPLTKANGGHGSAVLYGYRYALEHGGGYIFQTDSDGQTVPGEFDQFWDKRNEYDMIIGHRNHREDGLSRIFVTKTLKIVLKCVMGVSVVDANTPFRLIRRDMLEKCLKIIPENYNLPNVIIAAACEKKGAKVLYLPISFKERQGGVNSINIRRIVKIGLGAIKDFRIIKKQIEKVDW